MYKIDLPGLKEMQSIADHLPGMVQTSVDNCREDHRALTMLMFALCGLMLKHEKQDLEMWKEARDSLIALGARAYAQFMVERGNDDQKKEESAQ